jgi:hypothetical protein
MVQCGFWYRYQKGFWERNQQGFSDGSEADINGAQWGLWHRCGEDSRSVTGADIASVQSTFWQPCKTGSNTETDSDILLAFGKGHISDIKRFQQLFRKLYERIVRANLTQVVHATIGGGGEVRPLGGDQWSTSRPSHLKKGNCIPIQA